MDYEKIYTCFTSAWKQRSCEFNCVTNLHHIIPVSCGGSDDPSNLVRVTEREHLFLHLLLTRFKTGKQGMYMATAYGMMGGTKKVWNNARNVWLGAEFSDIACVTPKSAFDLGAAVLRQKDLKTKGFVKMLQKKWGKRIDTRQFKTTIGLFAALILLKHLGYSKTTYRAKVFHNKIGHKLGEDYGKVLCSLGLVKREKVPWIATTLSVPEATEIPFNDRQIKAFTKTLRKSRNVLQLDPWCMCGSKWLKSIVDKYQKYTTYIVVDKSTRSVTVYNGAGAVMAVHYKPMDRDAPVCFDAPLL